MDRLRFGARRFATEIHASQEERFRALSSGQAPDTLWIGCSDSRVCPTLLTATGPGDLFVVRNAGNLVPPAGQPPGGESASIEYAVKVLQVKHAIVCGHSDCGAVKAALAPPAAGTLPHVEQWIRHARPERGSAALARAVQANVVAQLEHLSSYPFVQEAVAQGRLQLHGWYYDIGSGTVHEYDPQEGSFVSLVAAEEVSA